MKLSRIAPALVAAALIIPVGAGVTAAAAAPGGQSWHNQHPTKDRKSVV